MEKLQKEGGNKKVKERANKICGSMTGGINIVNQQKS